MIVDNSVAKMISNCFAGITEIPSGVPPFGMEADNSIEFYYPYLDKLQLLSLNSTLSKAEVPFIDENTSININTNFIHIIEKFGLNYLVSADEFDGIIRRKIYKEGKRKSKFLQWLPGSG